MYRIKEISTPDGYFTLDEPYDFIMSYQDNDTSIILTNEITT